MDANRRPCGFGGQGRPVCERPLYRLAHLIAALEAREAALRARQAAARPAIAPVGLGDGGKAASLGATFPEAGEPEPAGDEDRFRVRQAAAEATGA